MKNKKFIAKALLHQLKNGFTNDKDFKRFYNSILKLCKNELITKKDCRILTNLCLEYNFNYFYLYY